MIMHVNTIIFSAVALLGCCTAEVTRSYILIHEPINIFDNKQKLCAKSYCVARNGLCHDYSCCECKCNKVFTFFDSKNGCLPELRIKKKLGLLEGEKTFSVFPKSHLRSSSSEILLVAQPKDIDGITLQLKSVSEETIDMRTCYVGFIHYVGFDGKMKKYNENLCQQVVKIQGQLNKALSLKWRSNFASHWNGMMGRIMSLKIICSLQSGKELHTSLLLQVTGSVNKENPSKGTAFSDSSIMCATLINNVVDGKVEAPQIVEETSSMSISLMTAIMVGLAVILTGMLIGILFACRAWKNKRERDISSRALMKPKTEENDYVQPTIPLSLTEDAGGYLIPAECGIYPENNKTTELNSLSETPPMDGDGYTTLTDIRRQITEQQ